VSVAEPTTAPGATEDASGALGDVARLVADLPPPAAVWCSGLRKQYGRQTAVQDVSLEVGRGEVVGLLGPNGAGKTSVIKMLLGLVRPDGGEVLLLGQSATDPLARARVGYLPELFRYQPWLSPLEVLTLHVRLSGIDVTPQERRDVLALVGLAERAEDRLGGFSKGMQQRLGLAVALVARPELVVLDEPTSALDPLGRVDVRDVVLALKAQGVAVLLNSHLIGEVERVCDRVVILDRGRVAASGRCRAARSARAPPPPHPGVPAGARAPGRHRQGPPGRRVVHRGAAGGRPRQGRSRPGLGPGGAGGAGARRGAGTDHPRGAAAGDPPGRRRCACGRWGVTTTARRC
jgi:ABC-2 type transport system ATP-binding protein